MGHKTQLIDYNGWGGGGAGGGIKWLQRPPPDTSEKPKEKDEAGCQRGHLGHFSVGRHSTAGDEEAPRPRFTLLFTVRLLVVARLGCSQMNGWTRAVIGGGTRVPLN